MASRLSGGDVSIGISREELYNNRTCIVPTHNNPTVNIYNNTELTTGETFSRSNHQNMFQNLPTHGEISSRRNNQNLLQNTSSIINNMRSTSSNSIGGSSSTQTLTSSNSVENSPRRSKTKHHQNPSPNSLRSAISTSERNSPWSKHTESWYSGSNNRRLANDEEDDEGNNPRECTILTTPPTSNNPRECTRFAGSSPFVRIIPELDSDINRNQSFPFLINDALERVKKSKEPTSLLRGPRRVFRLCLFAVLIPLSLVCVPLYVRLVVYPPQLYAMAPSDQRLLDRKVSSIWCQGQSVKMNGSFNAYVVPHTPNTSRVRPRYTVLKKLKLRDDVKEYWGFFLKEGSTVTLSACTRYDGGQLMILRGSDNLRRCAWIGEEDSMEENVNNAPTAKDFANLKVTPTDDSDEYEDSQTNRRIGSKVFALDSEIIKITFPERKTNISSNEILTSEERKGHVSSLLQKALEFSKDKTELMDLLNAHHGTMPTKPLKEFSDVAETNSIHVTESQTKTPKSNESNAIKSRFERSMMADYRDGAYEEVDESVSDSENTKKYTREEIGVEQIVGDVAIPAGLTYERGYFNQSNGHDFSREEHKSSYSSSEEALASCEGVILALPLQPDSKCNSFERQASNKIAYDISVDGTYYFVFSSDNEIVVNDLYFNLTFDKVVYDTSDNIANCTSSTNCSLSLNFWSEHKTVVDVPANERWDDSFVLTTNCEPRVALYFCLLLFVPILIVFCALK